MNCCVGNRKKPTPQVAVCDSTPWGKRSNRVCGKSLEVKREREDFCPLSISSFSDSLFTKYVLSCCCVLGIILGVRVVNQRDMGPALTAFTVYQGKQSVLSYLLLYNKSLPTTISIYYISRFQLQELKCDHMWVRYLGAAWLGGSDWRSLVRLSAVSHLGCSHPKASLGWWITSKVRHSRGWQVRPVFDRRSWLPFKWVSPWDAWASPWQGLLHSWSRAELYPLWCDLESHMSSSLLDSISHTSMIQSGRRLYNDMNTWRWGSWSATLETV